MLPEPVIRTSQAHPPPRKYVECDADIGIEVTCGGFQIVSGRGQPRARWSAEIRHSGSPPKAQPLETGCRRNPALWLEQQHSSPARPATGSPATSPVPRQIRACWSMAGGRSAPSPATADRKSHRGTALRPSARPLPHRRCRPKTRLHRQCLFDPDARLRQAFNGAHLRQCAPDQVLLTGNAGIRIQHKVAGRSISGGAVQGLKLQAIPDVVPD